VKRSDFTAILAEWLYQYDTKYRGTNKEAAALLTDHLEFDLKILNTTLKQKTTWEPEEIEET
jgi:hypothetical protein